MQKTLVFLLLLIFSFQSLSKAEDIRDFQIEGMSIGDSLLDHFNEEVIKNGIIKHYYKSTKFLRVEFWEIKSEKFDVISAHVNANDNKYIVYEITGAILFEDNASECYSKQTEIIEDLSELFKNTKSFDSGKKLIPDDNKSSYHRFDYIFKKYDSVDITCYNWSKDSGNTSHLAVAANSAEFNKWLQYEAYE